MEVGNYGVHLLCWSQAAWCCIAACCYGLPAWLTNVLRWLAGTFKLTLEFTEDYPNKAPVVKFKSTLFHPNGEGCLRGPTAAASNCREGPVCLQPSGTGG
jgi:hypothetical protein